MRNKLYGLKNDSLLPARIHFHTLDALRFFAFLAVFLFHVPVQGVFSVFSFLKQNGSTGVIFFFVLSGFLITYILVTEKIKEGQIRIQKFFVRRSFRIWPLYFLVVAIAYVVPFSTAQKIGMHMVGDGYIPDWRFSFTFTENYKMLLTDSFPMTSPLQVFWSLCVEEHFYIIWMFALLMIPLRGLRYFFAGTIVIAIISRTFEINLIANWTISDSDVLTNMDLFGLGGMLGYAAASYYEKTSNIINRIPVWTKCLFIVLTFGAIILHENIFPWKYPGSKIFSQTFYGLMLTCCIAIFIPQNSKLKISNRNILSRLGQISYGLYVWHILAIHIVFQYFIDHHIVIDDITTLSVFILITFTATVLMSIVSYRFFEKPFLVLREKNKGRNSVNQLPAA